MNDLVFRWGSFDNLSWSMIEAMISSISESERLIIGLFTDELAARYIDGIPEMDYATKERFFANLEFVERVIPIGMDNFSIEGVVDTLKDLGCDIPSTFMVGSEYGLLYEEDKRFALKNKITLKFDETPTMDLVHLRNLLSSNTYRKYRVVLFGTGKWFDSYMNTLGEEYRPIYAIDNSSEKWGTKKLGVEIKNPNELLKEEKKHLLVVICAKNSGDMVAQLLEMGDFEYRKLTAVRNGELAKVEEFRILLRDEKKYLGQINGCLLELLLEFDRVCKKYDLPYFLSCGSAIGAVRHHSFIPWDDDVDVAMYQEDFDILKSHVNEIWPEGSDYRLVCPGDLGNGAFLDFLNRLMLVREHVDTNIFDKVNGKADAEIQHTANLDIYILNNACPDEKKQQRNVLKLKAVYGLGMGHRAFVDYDSYKNYDFFTRFVVGVTSTVGRILPLSFIIWLHEHYARKFDKLDTDLCYESNGYAMTFAFDKAIFGRGKRIEVCNHELMVAIDVERYLVEHGYSNFMEYPPAHCRKPSHALKSPELV